METKTKTPEERLEILEDRQDIVIQDIIRIKADINSIEYKLNSMNTAITNGFNNIRVEMKEMTKAMSDMKDRIDHKMYELDKTYSVSYSVLATKVFFGVSILGTIGSALVAWLVSTFTKGVH
ncbi:MAG: hypothetical protein LBU73_01750 [Helicobacteraceae bacterium]|jgi:predicted glycosyltransferase|nr:hypothetical protein [Helicobacteraceae bacterium]